MVPHFSRTSPKLIGPRYIPQNIPTISKPMDKSQVIEKFNKENNHSLYDFLAYYGGIPLKYTDPKHSIEIVDFTNSTLTLNYIKGDRSKTTVIPFTPPLKSQEQAPIRLQLMAFEAADAFRLSPYRGDKYIYPPPGGMAFIGIVLGALGLSISPAFSYKLLSRRAPRLASFAQTKLRRALAILFFIHAWEYITFLRPRLDKFRVYGLLRLRWFISCLFEGFPSWLRYYAYTDKLIKQRQEFERQHK